nr:hypothetical protein [Kofleriaceae bacterium]
MWWLAVLAACGHAGEPEPMAAPVAATPATIVGTLPDGHVASVAIDARGTIAGVAAATAPAAAQQWLSTPVIDSHVHLSYWPVAARLAAAGVEGVVDLASPEAALADVGTQPIHMLAAGPMLTRDGGYPLASWGADGYGTGCHDAACVTATVDRLAREGAGVIKIAGDDDGLPAELYPTAVAAAHAHHLRVAAHELSEAGARVAGQAGVDILAHTPVEPLSAATIALWRGRAVISTLAAFGGGDAAVANLRALRAAGCTVLYGTDLGNSRDAGPSADEIALLERAGLDAAAITDAMTTVPAAFWGFQFALAPRAEATFLVLDRDPRRDPRAFLQPAAVYVRGTQLAR